MNTLNTSNQEPRYLRIYDNGGRTADRYTIVYTGRRGGWYRSSCETPSHPGGVYMAGEGLIDRPTSSHLGRRIKFDQLPQAVRSVVLQEYVELWGVL